MIYGLLRITNANDPFKVLDDVFFNKKINRFDTANCYGNSEKIFGEWLSSRNINRKDFYIICKGGHHSYNGEHRVTMNDILADLNESFERLKITYADSFMFHRDDESVSAEKIYEICNYLLENNFCKKIGVSNWKTSRIESINCIKPVIEESQIFLNYIKLSRNPYPNIHMINYSDYMWYINHPEHKIQIYSVACFLNDLDNNSIHQNKIFKNILEHICHFTSESKQTILYVLLSKCKGLNVECIQGSISPDHILKQATIDNIFSMIEENNPYLTDFISCFLVENPNIYKKNDVVSFLMNGYIGPVALHNDEKIDSIVNWLLEKNYNDYSQMKHHHEYNDDIKQICTDQTIHDLVSTYIGYECICYNTEFFVRKNNDDFTYTANWHIDPYINLDDTYPQFTIQIGLSDNNENNSLHAILGSHLFDYQNKFNNINKSNQFAPLVDIDENIDKNLICKLLNKKGYVYLFSNYLTHGKGLIKDNDANVRVALTMRIISKRSIINKINDSHISKDIFTLGSDSDDACKLVWSIVQNKFRSLFKRFTVDDIKNKTYTWENSTITFLDNFKMDAFGYGEYKFVDQYNIVATFGGRVHNIKFNDNYTTFVSTRDDLHIQTGKIFM
jgi:predicted oxidoreductase